MIAPILCKYGTSAASLTGAGLGNIVDSHSVAEITAVKFLNESVITSCNIEIYAR